MKVSVVIPTKNAGPLFKRVLSSIFSQKTNWPFEVLVVDSGSSDETLRIVKEFPPIRLIQIKKEDFGHGKTRNLAISKTKGEYIAMITQDALPANNYWLSEFVKTIESDSKIAGVFGRHIAYPEASKSTKKELEVHFRGFESHLIVNLDDRSRYLADDGYRQLLYFFSDNNALLKKEVWQKIPYPEVNFAEDQAWAKSIIEAGYSKAYSPDAIVYHSHNYGIIERFQRSFEETYYLYEFFKYRKNRSFIRMMANYLYILNRDIKWVLFDQNTFTWRDLKDLLLMPIYNFMRVFGSYLGLFANNMNPILRDHLCRDNKIKNV